MNMITRRQFASQIGMASLGLATAGVLSGPLLAATGSLPPPFDIMPYVHPELRKIVPRLLPMTAVVPSAETLSAMRKGSAAYAVPRQNIWH